MRAYYLTAAPFALANIALQRIKIARLSDLNDPFELLAANLANQRHRDAFENMKQQLNSSGGLICFSKNWSNPLLWGHYADKHAGMALGFDVADHMIAEVLYATDRIQLQIDPRTNDPVLNEKVVKHMMRTKFIDWHYEEERRVFVKLNHTTRESGLYYLNFSEDIALKEVVLGPRCELPIDKLRQMVVNYPLSVHVLKSKMDPEKFRVIEDEQARD